MKIHYEEQEKALFELLHQKGLDGIKGAFDSLAQSSSTCNLGPQTVTPMHRDAQNLSYGLCMVSAFGDFDGEDGGELLLYEPGAVVQMLPGDLLIFPSAAITHGNLKLSERPNQVKYSFTHYTSGSLFQWVANGGSTVKEAKNAAQVPAVADWHEGWSKYSTFRELQRNSVLYFLRSKN